jgi:hypothetical protein
MSSFLAANPSSVSDLARKSDTSGGHDVSEDGKLGDASVLGLDGAEAVEAGLVRSPRGSQNPRGA